MDLPKPLRGEISFIVSTDHGVLEQPLRVIFIFSRRRNCFVTSNGLFSVLSGNPILLLPLRCGLHFHQDLIECRTIKEPAVGDNDVDFLGVPDVVERVCAQQH